tara:strand:- start:1809 stop:2576 length:768 start_codon:yes stop_codon:yes gene_type:complete
MNIPKNIYICDKTITNIEKISKKLWKDLNPEYSIKLYDDEMCKQFFLKYYSPLHLRIFNSLKDGPIKSDFWRVCILYKFGGIYSDADNEPLIPLRQFIDEDVIFITCSSYWESHKFNPNFIAAPMHSPILKSCMEWYISKYMNKEPYDYWGWSIMTGLSKCLILRNFSDQDGIYLSDYGKVQILKECEGNNHHDDHNIYNNIRIFNNRMTEWDHKLHQFKTPIYYLKEILKKVCMILIFIITGCFLFTIPPYSLI